jgi:outer membrane receptor protein involved in Fe transport
LRALVLWLSLIGVVRAQPSPSPSPEPEPVARIRGRVIERGTRTPLPASVFAVDEKGVQLAEAHADQGGGFALELLPSLSGKIHVVVTAPDHKRLELDEKLAPREVVTVVYVIARGSYSRYESTVRAAPVREEIARVSLSGEEIRRIPGTRGDALAAVLNLPSVARSPFDLGQLVIRGSAPGESGAFLLGMAIPLAFHFGGLTSTFNSYLLDRFDLIPSNFSVRYGRLVGGLVDIVPREGKNDRIHGDIKMDLYDFHVIVEGPIKKGSFALSLRRSYVDAVLGAVIGEFTHTTSFTVAPVYYDYQAMLDYPVLGGKFKLLIFGSDDQLKLVNQNAPDTDPSLQGQFTNHNWFHTLFASYKKNIRRWEFETTLAVGPQHFDASLGQAARFNLDLVEMDARLEARWRVWKTFRLTMGFDIQSDYHWVSVDAPRITTEEKPQGPLTGGHVTKQDQGYEASPALYLAADIQAHPRLLITPGVRVDWFSNSSRTYMQPRIMVRAKLAERTFLKMGAGLFEEPPQPPYADPVLGNPRVRAEQAWHVTAGIETRPIPKYPPFSIELNLFYKDIQYIAVSSENYILNNGRVTPEVYSDEGIGRVYGGDILLRHDSNKYVYGWIAYTLEKSERQDHPGDPWRPFQYDQTNILTLVLGTHLPWEIDLGIRFRYVTGNPNTPYIGSIYDADRDVHLPIPGQPYSERLPDFLQLDARIDKRFIFKGWVLGLYIDVSNVTNHSNVEGYSYSYDYRKRSPVNSLPILPSLGIRASF